jgi:hypothetical protein
MGAAGGYYLLSSSYAFAQEPIAAETETFRVDFLSSEEMESLVTNGARPRDLQDEEKEALIRALGYFSAAINPAPCLDNQTASCLVRLVVGGDDSLFLTGTSRVLQGTAGEYNFVLAQEILARGIPKTYNFTSPKDYAMALSIGQKNYSYASPTLQPAAPWNLQALLVAELTRALGLIALPDREATAGARDTLFGSLVKKETDEWHFLGNTAGTVYGDGNFLPLPMKAAKGDLRNIFLLKSTLLSDSYFINYSAPVEVELAALIDIGYDIELDKHFGRSVYTDGSTVTNGLGFLSSVPFGVGLHVYGSFNTVIQEADLFASGPGAAGVRIDGLSNSLNLESTSEIKAQGPNGVGILVAFGADHTLNIKGTIFGGAEGIKADFGYNLVDDLESLNADGYGKYSLASHYKPQEDLPQELMDYKEPLSGPLVKLLAISGLVQGNNCAIYASTNAHVETIRIHTGARIDGDIISDYDDRGAGTDFATRLILGLVEGSPEEIDKDFQFSITGRILGSGKKPGDLPERLYLGRGQIDLMLLGGVTTIEDSARVEVRSVTLKAGATLEIKPDLALCRPIFLEANAINFEEGSSLKVSFSTSPDFSPADRYITPLLKVTVSSPEAFLNEAKLELDPAAKLEEGELRWFYSDNFYLLVYLKPGARFPG